MTIATTIDASQDVLRQTVGVKQAPRHNQYPGSIKAAHCPIVLVWPDSGDAYQKGANYNIHTMVYRVTVYTLPAELGKGISEGWNRTADLMQDMLDDLLDSDNNLLVSGTYQAYIRPAESTPIIHNGFEVIAYPPQATGTEGFPHYYGFQFLLPVNEQWSQT
jgi:hypothetical protein